MIHSSAGTSSLPVYNHGETPLQRVQELRRELRVCKNCVLGALCLQELRVYPARTKRCGGSGLVSRLDPTLKEGIEGGVWERV